MREVKIKCNGDKILIMLKNFEEGDTEKITEEITKLVLNYLTEEDYIGAKYKNNIILWGKVKVIKSANVNNVDIFDELSGGE